MHPNPAFRTQSQKRNIAFAQDRAFGTLAINAKNGPLLSHVPFRFSEDEAYLELHLVRSNPIVKMLEKPLDAVISILGGDTYVSPDWYHVDDQVPTWNYIAVHIRGTLTLLPHDELHGVLTRLSKSMEDQLLPKKPWESAKMNQDVYERMLRQIVPAKLDIAQIDGTWKLSQNKTDEVRLSAAHGVEQAKMGSQTDLVANLMRKTDDLG